MNAFVYHVQINVGAPGAIAFYRALFGFLDYRVPVEIRGIRVRPGDIVFGDQDGVLIIPREAEKEAISLALEKADTDFFSGLIAESA